MTTPGQEAGAAGAPSPMMREQWRAVNAILQGALSCEPARRDAFVAEACVGDEALRREVASLLAAHDRAGDDFLERPAVEVLDGESVPPPIIERLANALAGRYEIERELARGGMATVYLARDLRHERRVAIKVLREEFAAAVGAERFLEEIRVTASLQHPHILPLFDSGNAAGLLWYAMPFVEGETLRARLARDGRLPVDIALQLVREMADALEHAHGHGVVHRDVKPENVLLQSGHALVADFGIALALEHAGGDRLTRTGITLGTPQYMAPEQAAGERAVDARTDVYALGAVLHEMLAGESPFAAESRQAMLHRVMHEPAVALSTRRADVPSSLDAAVQRALAKRPEDRFPSASAFAAALDSDERVTSVRAVPSRQRVVSARAALYAAMVMVAIGLVGGWVFARSSLLERWAVALSGSVRPPLDGLVALSPAMADDLTLTVVNRTGRPERTIAANRPWTPRISPDGRQVAYGAFGGARSSSDIWVTAIGTGTTRRLTDDENDSNDPQWSADGRTVAYSASAPGGKDLLMQKVGDGEPRVLAARNGTQFASDWMRDGRALLVTEEAGRNRHDILVQPVDGSAPWPYAATSADETAARASPDGRWVAYTSDESGRAEVYLDSYPKPGRRVSISSGGGAHPVWRGDGRELFYWSDGRLVAVQLGKAAGDAIPATVRQTVLFRAPYQVGPNTMYDVSPDGQRFVIVQQRENRSKSW
jgi:hypothetical protein